MSMRRAPRAERTMRLPDLVVGLGISTMILAGCDGGGEFAAAAAIINDCDVPVTVTVGETYERELAFPRPDQTEPIAPASQFTLNNAMLKPIADEIYVYVASPDDAVFADPFPLNPTDLSMVNDGRADIYTIVISGDMCPAS